MNDHHRLLPSAALVLALALLGACASDGGADPEEGLAFAARHDFRVEVPAGTRQLRIWLPVPDRSDPDQDVESFHVDAAFPSRRVRDLRGNEFLLVEVENPPAGELALATRFDLVRREVRADIDPGHTRPHTAAELAALASDLAPSSQSVIDADVRAMARRAVGDETNPIRAARLLYDAVLEHVEYHVKDPKPDASKTMNSTGTGNSRLTYETCTGNCTDFHSLYAALARASGIPTRVVYGSFFKGPLNGADQDQSYHCWIEFHAPEIGWIPLDVAVADIFVDDFVANENSRPRAVLTVADGYDGPDPELVDYYFGNLDARRVVWHRGRDLVMVDPRQSGGPLLWNPKGYAEADGVAVPVARKLTFREKR